MTTELQRGNNTAVKSAQAGTRRLPASSRHAAIDIEFHASDIAAFSRCQEQGGSIDLVGMPEAFHGNAVGQRTPFTALVAWAYEHGNGIEEAHLACDARLTSI